MSQERQERPPREPIPDPRTGLKRLGEILETRRPRLEDWAVLGSPQRLDLLISVHLRALLRRGPGPGEDGHRSLLRLLTGAAQAAAAGLVPLATLSAARRLLDGLEEILYRSGAWDPARPPWWGQPPRSPLEELWDSLESLVRRPSGSELQAAFTAPNAPRWLPLPTLLDPELTRRLHEPLERAFQEGRLDLERAGIGAAGKVSTRRTDFVCYVTGLEGDLLTAAPEAAAVSQWLLRRAGDEIASTLSGLGLQPPRRAMLARYPAPSGGYSAHQDNPGGGPGSTADNGRALTLTVYLNAPSRECAGGELALWAPGQCTDSPPAAVLPPRSGAAVLLDSRAVAHQVCAVGEGPARWAMTFWLNDTLEPLALQPPLPKPTLTDLLLPVEEPPLPPGSVLFHELSEESPAGEITVRSTAAPPPRCGAVCTVYRGGRGLDAWCAHHFAVGVEHLVLIFDRLEDPTEGADADRLRHAHGEERLTIWSGSEAAKRWGELPVAARPPDLLDWAAGGPTSFAVAARQTLAASLALEAARSGELGGARLDWLLHLDSDELLLPLGPARGGTFLPEHLKAVASAGFHRVRYANHELLLPCTADSPARFKANPALATARLGVVGWQRLVEHLVMAPSHRRPYFNAYSNGKSAVRVDAAVAAAGVHGWQLKDRSAPGAFLAGPVILHVHAPSPRTFRRKYLSKASRAEAEPGASKGPVERPFRPSAMEEAAFETIREMRQAGKDEAAVGRRLEELHGELTAFSPRAAELLGDAGLLLEPASETVAAFVAAVAESDA